MYAKLISPSIDSKSDDVVPLGDCGLGGWPQWGGGCGWGIIPTQNLQGKSDIVDNMREQ